MNKISVYHPFSSRNENFNLLGYLKEIQSIVTSSVGPHAKLKLISKSKNENISLTNASRFLIKSFYNFIYIKTKPSVENDNEYIKWLFDLILKTVQIHVDNHYDSGILTIYLINDFYLVHATETKYQHLIELSFNELIRHFSETNGECKIKLKLDLGNLNHFKLLFKSIFGTKNVYRLSFKGQKDEDFLNLFLKANLNSFQSCSESSSVDQVRKYFSLINYQFYTKDFNLTLNDSKLFNGVLIPVETLTNLHLIESIMKRKAKQSQLKCILFDTQLSADFEQFNLENCTLEIEFSQTDRQGNNVFLLLEKLKSLCDILVASRVDVVFCQKVIHPSVKGYLIERNCIPIDRLSITYTDSVVELTNCKICKSGFNVDQLTDGLTYGYLTQLSIKRLDDISRVYLHLENQTTLNQTMIVCLGDELFLDEIQYLIKVVESCFQRTILTGFMFCGGACFYSYTICYLWKYCNQAKELHVTRPQVYSFMLKIKTVFVNFFKHLLKDSNEFYDYYIDSKTGHVYLEENKTCECRLHVNEEKKDRIELFENDFNMNLFDFSSLLQELTSPNRIPNVLDCFESKINSFILVKNILVTVFQIGVFISD